MHNYKRYIMRSTPHSSPMKNFLSIDFRIYFGLECVEVDLLEKIMLVQLMCDSF